MLRREGSEDREDPEDPRRYIVNQARDAQVKPVLLAILLGTMTRNALAADRPVPVILDTDIGDDIDDALNLALILQSPELDLKAVITVLNAGDVRAALAYRILELHGRTDIPVGIGAEQTLLGKPSRAIPIQAAALPPGYTAPGPSRNGVRLMIDTILLAPEKITLVAVGPLTNVALALRSEPRLQERIERIVLMSGVFFRAGLEYNVHRDAEAAAIVYASGLPISTVGLDVTLQCRLGTDEMQRLAKSNFENVTFLYRLIVAWQNGDAAKHPILHDPLASLAMLKPSLVNWQRGRVEIETRGIDGRSQGLSVFRKDAEGTVEVAETVRADEAVSLFIDRVAARPRSR